MPKAALQSERSSNTTKIETVDLIMDILPGPVSERSSNTTKIETPFRCEP